MTSWVTYSFLSLEEGSFLVAAGHEGWMKSFANEASESFGLAREIWCSMVYSSEGETKTWVRQLRCQVITH